MHNTVFSHAMTISLSICVLFSHVRGQHAVSLAVYMTAVVDTRNFVVDLST